MESASAGTIDQFLESDPLVSTTGEASNGKLLESLEAELEVYETQLKELNSLHHDDPTYTPLLSHVHKLVKNMK